MLVFSTIGRLKRFLWQFGELQGALNLKSNLCLSFTMANNFLNLKFSITNSQLQSSSKIV